MEDRVALLEAKIAALEARIVFLEARVFTHEVTPWVLPRTAYPVAPELS